MKARIFFSSQPTCAPFFPSKIGLRSRLLSSSTASMKAAALGGLSL